MVRTIAGVTALIGWAALALQLVLIIDNLGPALGLWRFAGFFTILTNVGVAVVASSIALDNRGALSGPRARLMAATSVAIVGFVYSFALRALWNPTGLQKLADLALHDATPLLFVVIWLLSPHPGLAWRNVSWAILPPVLYAIYALGRGSLDGWYAYWFLDPSEQSAVDLLASIAALLCGTAAVAAVLVSADKLLAKKFGITISRAPGP